eukprot:PhM_4_TR2375/c0_g1_i1/m.57691
MQCQLSCNGCSTVLAYPAGAPSVRCPICTTVTPVMQIHITCVTCRTVLALPVNTTLAMCPRCRTVMSVPPMGVTPHMQHVMQQHQQQQQQQQSAGVPPKEVVYVDTPPTKDESGKTINSMAIGTKLANDPA